MSDINNNSPTPVTAAIGRLMWLIGVMFGALLAESSLAAGEETFSVSYAGRLTQANGAPVEGPVDIDVSFWTAATDGEQRGRSISKPGINLSNGLFTIDLPLSGPDLAAVFGNGTNAVYIEVTAAGKTYPRQRFLYTPLALRVPVDESHLEYSDTSGKLRIKMDSGATDGSVMTSDGRGGFTWKKIDATQLVAKNEANAAPSDKQVLTYSNGKWIAADPSQSSNTLTTISGIAPITVAGSGTAPSISIAKASGTASGYLSSGDWSAFNSKQDALSFAPLNKAGDTLGGALNMNGKALTGLATPADPGDAASKSYVDTLALRRDGSMPLSANWNVGGKDIVNAGNIGIGSTEPSAKLDLVGQIKIQGGSPGAGKVLTSDADGLASWTAPAVGSVTLINTGVGLTGGPITGSGTIELANTNVTPGTYNRATITVDQQGRLTAASSGAAIVDADIDTAANIAQTKISGLGTSLAGKEPTITGGTPLQYWRGDKSWETLNTDAVTEATNQYFTAARAKGVFTATAPVSYNFTTGDISIAQASGTGNGYLSSTDWNTFNAKQSALGYTPLNQAGDTITGSLIMASAKIFGLSPNASDPALSGDADEGKMWFNSTSNELKYWDGSTVKTLGVAGSGLQSFNGQTNNSQTLATGWSSGTAPNWVSSAGTHTLNIPLASSAGVAAGLISAGDFTTFNTKVGSVAAGNGMQVSTVGTTATVSLPSTGTSGTYAKVTTDGYGRVTAGTSLTAADLPPHSAGLINSGTLSIANGGTGLSAAPTNGQLLIGNAGNFALGALSQGAKAGVSILSGAGSITLDTAQDIRTTASPTFNSLSVSSLTAPVILQAASAAPPLSAAGQGKIYFDQTDNEFKISQNGGAYTKLASGGTVTNITTGTGLTGGPITAIGTISLSNTAVTPGSYTRANITVDAQGRLTAAQSAAAIVDSDVAAGAAIAQSKISGLTTDLAAKEPTVAAGTNTQYYRGDKTWQTLNTTVLAEGTNQYFTPARAISSLSGSAPITYSTVTGTIGISQSSGSSNGYLSSADWSTFNAKQNALGYSPVNKAGDTLTGALNAGGFDLANTGNIQMAASKTLALSSNPTDPAGLTVADKGKTWYNTTSNQIKFWDGSTVQPLGVAGSGVGTLNGQTGNVQTFAVPGTSGTAPAWSSNANVHTLNIPMSSAASVTAGLLSNTDYTTFSNKVANVASGTGISVATASGTATVSLTATGTAGSYTKVTTDAYGRVTAGTSLTATDLPPHSAGLITSGTLNVANGGTGATSLTANNVILGNGTSPVQVVAPGASGNVLTSNGTTWQSTTLPATNWAAPGTIGATTPNTGAFTSVTSNAQAGYEAKPYGTATGNTGEVRLDELAANGTNYVGFKAPDVIGANKVWVLPANDGTAGQVLKTDGAGNLGWASDGGGTVTNVTGTSPISVATGTSTPVISMTQANTTTAGYLSAADWNTFNGKQAAGNYLTALTGDVTTSAFNAGSATATLASVALAGTSTKVTYDVKGRVTVGTTLSGTDIPPLSAALITSGTLAVANGGTGLTSIPSNGQIPIGNGAGYSLATLTGGTGINITNAAGAVTIASTADPSTKVSLTGDTMTGVLNLPTNGLNVGSGQFTAANGNVGIGTTAPEAPLDVNGNVYIESPGRLTLKTADSTTTAFFNQSSLRLYNTALGTTAPNNTITFSTNRASSGYTPTDYAKITGGKENSTADDAGGYLTFSTTVTGTPNTQNERMRITSNGNVGIGTTTPNAKLSFGTNGGPIHFYDEGTAGTRYGIGTSSSTLQLFIPSGQQFSFNTGGDLQATGTNELVRITSAGNVGIGTTNPAEKLDVAGNIRTTGAVVYNTLQDFKLVYREDFESNTTGWTNTTRTTCGSATILGGYNAFSAGSTYKDYDLTGIPHTEVMVKLTYYFIDTWDGESAYIQIGGISTYYKSHIASAAGVSNICGLATGEHVAATESRISHTANSLRVLVGSTLDQAASDESFGVDNVEIWVR